MIEAIREAHYFQSNSTEPATASPPRIFLYCLRRLPLGSLRCPGPRRVYWETAVGPRRSSSHRTTDSFADPHHILAGRAASSSSCFPRLAADQAACARPRLLFYPGHARRGGLELFLLCCHPAHQRGHRYHRAIHRSGVGAALRGSPRQQRLTVQKVAAVALAVTGIALVIDIFGAKSGPALHLDPYGLIAALLASFSLPSTTSADTASSPATTAGGCSSGPLPRPQPSGSLSILPGKSPPPTTLPPNGYSFSFFR